MEWDQCRRNLIRCGMKFPEEYEDIDAREVVAEIEQYGGVVMSYEPWDNCWGEFKKAIEKYYGKPMPLEPPEPANATE